MANVADRSLSAEIGRALRWHIEQANEQEETYKWRQVPRELPDRLRARAERV